MDAAAIRAFVRRDRETPEALKRSFWAERYRALGPAATVAASEVLRAHMRRTRPDWPTAEDRAADLAHHVALKRKIDRAAHAFTAG